MRALGRAPCRCCKTGPHIEVLFTDVVLPGIDGLTLAMWARRLLPELKVILVSGYNAPGLHSRLSGLHDVHFLAKPFQTPDLARLLRL